jgi:hypothetical protein
VFWIDTAIIIFFGFIFTGEQLNRHQRITISKEIINEHPNSKATLDNINSVYFALLIYNFYLLLLLLAIDFKSM